MASKKKPAKKAAEKSEAKVSSPQAEAVEAPVEYAQVAPVPVPVPEVERPPNPNPGWECLDINRKALIWFILVTLGVAIATFIGMIPVLANLTKAEMKKGDSAYVALKDADKPESYREQLEQFEQLQVQQGSYKGRDRLQADPPREIVELVESQEKVLATYAYNAETKRARIPIEVAMEKMLKQGVKSGKPKAMVMTPELEKGKAIFLGVGACFTCHGNTGRGDGPAAVALNPKPRSFASGEYLFDTDGDGIKGSPADLRNILKFGTIKYGGSPLMPPRPDIMGEDLENLVKFVQALKAE